MDNERLTEAFRMADAAVELLRRRIIDLEAEIALLRGALAPADDDRPATYTHDVPPNAPR